jgi:acyl-CoA reductase-like NAD-dependent aldehyde dehydrogenase
MDAQATATSKTTIHPEIVTFLSSPRKLLIDGEWVSARSGDTFVSINPATAAILGHAAAGDRADVDLAVAVARRAFDKQDWAGMSPHERSRLLLRIAELIESNAEELAQLESLGNGAPLAIARLAIAGVADTFIYYAGWATKIYGETNPSAPGIFNYTLREPVGVCGQIVPWNGPLTSAAWKVAPALAGI